MYKTIFNDALRYQPLSHSQEVLPLRIPENPVYAATENEEIVRIPQPYQPTSVDALCQNKLLDAIDFAIVTEVARSKYLSTLQIFQFLCMRGFSLSRLRINKRLLKLCRFRLLQEWHLKRTDCVHSIRYFSIDGKGYKAARALGVFFHKGNCYNSNFRKEELGLKDDAPWEVKRILCGNQIVAGLLVNGARLSRFGILETFCPNEVSARSGSILRTTACAKLDDTSILAYEVVRNTPESHKRLLDKISRYYALLASSNYLSGNLHGDTAFPQLVICGETFEHNLQILSLLQSHGLLRAEHPLLFTEDLLNIRDSLRSLYALDINGRRRWYGIPMRESCGDSGSAGSTSPEANRHTA